MKRKAEIDMKKIICIIPTSARNATDAACVPSRRKHQVASIASAVLHEGPSTNPGDMQEDSFIQGFEFGF